jgi:polyferredoxin
MWFATVTIGAILVIACLSNTHNTPSIIGLCISLFLFCVVGLLYKTNIIQHFRPLILLISLICLGFIFRGCSCILFYFQGFILFLAGKSAFWLSFTVITAILVLSVIFGAIWCGWICVLGALQEFIFKHNKWNLLKTKKANKILIYIQAVVFVIFVIWTILAKYPVLCSYDPFISIFRLRIFNWVGYISVPLLLVSSLFIYRPFCRIICPIGLLLYVIKYLPFAAKLKILECTNCRKCHTYCEISAINEKKTDNNCMMCGECKKANCRFIIM